MVTYVSKLGSSDLGLGLWISIRVGLGLVIGLDDDSVLVL